MPGNACFLNASYHYFKMQSEQMVSESVMVSAVYGYGNVPKGCSLVSFVLQGMPKRGDATLRRHGDIFQRLPGGFYRAQGRSDDTMNLGGIKASCLSLHETFLRTAALLLDNKCNGSLPMPSRV